jgi:ubiquinone/menaquinone biosynthesis C-methylase UbiE
MNDDIREIHEHVLSLLDAKHASAVLDPGCGRGEHLRMLASQTGKRVRLVGIDSSEASIEAARAAAGGDPRFEYLVQDLAEGIPFASETFDRILCVNVLEAIPDKAAFLAEVHRVLSAQGRLVFAHFDWDSQLFDGMDKPAVRKVMHAFADWKQKWMADADGWMGRRRWRTFQETRLFEGRVDACVHTSTRFEPEQYGWERSKDFGSMVKRGLITADEYESFLEAQKELAARDQYFYSITMFSYVGRKARALDDCALATT